MGYSRSKRAVMRMLPFLEAIMESRMTGRPLVWETDDPPRMAYRLREALHAARFHEEFQHFGRLRPHLGFKVGPKEVIAYWLAPEVLPYITPEPQAPKPREVTVHEQVNVQDLLASMMSQHRTTFKVYFPNVLLEPGDMNTIYTWANEMGWALIDHEEAGLTLTKEPIDNDLKWSPKP